MRKNDSLAEKKQECHSSICSFFQLFSTFKAPIQEAETAQENEPPVHASDVVALVNAFVQAQKTHSHAFDQNALL